MADVEVQGGTLLDLHGDRGPQIDPLAGTGYALVRASDASRSGVPGYNPTGIEAAVKAIVGPVLKTSAVAVPAAILQTSLQRIGVLAPTRIEAQRETSADLLNWIERAKEIDGDFWRVVNDTTHERPVRLAIDTFGPDKLVGLFGDFVKTPDGTRLVDMTGVRQPSYTQVQLRNDQTSVMGVIPGAQVTDRELKVSMELSAGIRQGQVGVAEVGTFIKDKCELEVHEVLAEIGVGIAKYKRHVAAEKHVTKTVTLAEARPLQQIFWGIVLGGGIPDLQTMFGGIKVMVAPYDIYQNPGEVPITIEKGKEPMPVGTVGSTAVGPVIADQYEVTFLPTEKENRDARPNLMTRVGDVIHGKKTEALPIGQLVVRSTGTNYQKSIICPDPRGLYHKYLEFVGRRAALWAIARGNDGIEGKETEDHYLQTLWKTMENYVQTRFTRPSVVQAVTSQHLNANGGLPPVKVVVNPDDPSKKGTYMNLDVYGRGGGSMSDRVRFYGDLEVAYRARPNKRLIDKALGEDTVRQILDDFDFLRKSADEFTGRQMLDGLMAQYNLTYIQARDVLLQERGNARQRLYGDILAAEEEARKKAAESKT